MTKIIDVNNPEKDEVHANRAGLYSYKVFGPRDKKFLTELRYDGYWNNTLLSKTVKMATSKGEEWLKNEE